MQRETIQRYPPNGGGRKGGGKVVNSRAPIVVPRPTAIKIKPVSPGLKPRSSPQMIGKTEKRPLHGRGVSSARRMIRRGRGTH